MSKMSLRLCLYVLLAISVGCIDAWLWSWTVSTTEAPSANQQGFDSSTGIRHEQSIAGVGEEIINVASGIRESVQTWDQNPDEGSSEPNTTAPASPTGPGNLTDTSWTASVVEPRIVKGDGMGNITSALQSADNGTSVGEEGGSGSGSSARDRHGDTVIYERIMELISLNDNVDAETEMGHSGMTKKNLSLITMDNQSNSSEAKGTNQMGNHLKSKHLIFNPDGSSYSRNSSKSSFNYIYSDNDTNVAVVGQPYENASIGNVLNANNSKQYVYSNSSILESPGCLPIDWDLQFCTSVGVQSFMVPNFFNHSSMAEVREFYFDWEWLLKSRCHCSLEWFFCLLLVPRCGSEDPRPALPCRSFCEVLLDSCWRLLDEGRFPVACHSLPDEEDDGNQCLSVSSWKGKCRLRCMPFAIHFEPAPPVCLCVRPLYLIRAHFATKLHHQISLICNGLNINQASVAV